MQAFLFLLMMAFYLSSMYFSLQSTKRKDWLYNWIGLGLWIAGLTTWAIKHAIQ